MITGGSISFSVYLIISWNDTDWFSKCTKEHTMENGKQPPDSKAPGPDRQAVIVAACGLFVVGVIVLIAVLAFPGSVPQGQVNTTGQNIVSVATAATNAAPVRVGPV